MTDAEDWANGIWVAGQLLGEEGPALLDDARVLVERLTRNVMLCSGPIELFSKEMPVYSHQPGESENLAPIDVLYGRYLPEHLRIEIFVNRIRADAKQFGSGFLDLLTIIRIHEYAHAVVHTGINTSRVPERLEKFRQGEVSLTDWESLRTERDLAFCALDEESHELLAQAITWACITNDSTYPRVERLRESFLALEQRQPSRYQLPPELKRSAHRADWDLVLRAAQGDLHCYRGLSFTLPDGLAELIRLSVSRPSFKTELGALQGELASVDFVEGFGRSAKGGPDGMMRLLVKELQRIKLKIDGDKNHKRPHLHVDYGNKYYAASYAIDNGERLAGKLERKYERAIRTWIESNKAKLLEAWQFVQLSKNTEEIVTELRGSN